jgi:hypothetical protein
VSFFAGLSGALPLFVEFEADDAFVELFYPLSFLAGVVSLFAGVVSFFPSVLFLAGMVSFFGVATICVLFWGLPFVLFTTSENHTCGTKVWLFLFEVSDKVLFCLLIVPTSLSSLKAWV